MTLATKSGSLILKGGKLAEKCGCCGDWYCDVAGGGACCEDGVGGAPPTCSIKTSCDCVGTGQTFKGVGTTCAGASCCLACASACQSPLCIPRYVVVSVSATTQEYVTRLFNDSVRVPAVTISGTVTLSGEYNTTYPCGAYIGHYEGAAAASLNGSAAYVQAHPGGNYGYIRVKKQAHYGNRENGIVSLTLSNDWPFDPWNQYVEFTFRFSTASVTSGGALQNAASGYCYGLGTSQLMWVQYSFTTGEFETAAGSMTTTSSYGSGIPHV